MGDIFDILISMRFALLLAAITCFILLNQAEAKKHKKGSGSKESSESGSKSDSKSDSGSCECPDGTTGSPIRLELEETNRKKGSSSESSESGSKSCECGGPAGSDV